MGILNTWNCTDFLKHTIATRPDFLNHRVEIQACPRAIMALRYFYEELPELHLVAAGSLLEFAFAEISVPVGRVQYLRIHPMTFHEYLTSINRTKMAEMIREKRGSNAEVDYLAVRNGKIYPVEVKSGASGSLRSLHLMLETYPNCPEGIVLSTRLYDQLPEQKLRFLPLYTAAILTVTEPATSKGSVL